MDASDVDYPPGTVIAGKYRLDRELGRGGMGAVFAATNLVLEAPVAIKVLQAGVRPTSALAGRFVQEARAAASVRHANIVGVLDFGQDEATGALFLVQEYLHGCDLKRRVQERGPLSPRAAIELLLPVMRALAHAHGKGVVHRDLKPENIFLHDTPEGVVPKVIDFGIARVTDDQGQSLQHTRTSQVLGTPGYMSPEQARGDRAVDPRSDVWSLGVVLYYLLTRRLPHEGETANLIMASIITRPPRPVTDHAPDLPPPVVALLDGALQYDVARRYASMEAFWEAARACLGALGVAVAPAPERSVEPAHTLAPSPLAPFAPADIPTVAPQVMATDGGVIPRRARGLVAATAGVLALMAAFGGYWSGRSTPRATGAAPRSIASSPESVRAVEPPPPPPLPAPAVAPRTVEPPPAAPAAVATRRAGGHRRAGQPTAARRRPGAVAPPPTANVAY